MPKKIDIIGTRYGRLVVVADAAPKNGRRRVSCQCDCGASFVCDPRSVKKGDTRSCGCLHKEEVARAAREKATHGDYGTKEYNTWIKIKDRCGNPKNPKYPSYGGRGITVCAEWQVSYEAFLRDLGGSPTPNHSIDRINNNLGYEPGNCRWATNLEQSRNKRKHRFVLFNGREIPLSQACEEARINYRSALYRLNNGLDWMPHPPAPNPESGHSEKLRHSLQNVADSLSSRPVELRGPFESGATRKDDSR